jgi:hypothetical protein
MHVTDTETSTVPGPIKIKRDWKKGCHTLQQMERAICHSTENEKAIEVPKVF